ncbi:MAG: hypothetical protein DRJ63_05725 [Thermoprotei archaeon]|nr:MAG: hypothetical protein DRJ63_05725 [Thermoprotei archaeon]
MFFIDSTIFIKWISARRKVLSLSEAISGYVLYKVSRGVRAVTSTLVKDEVLIWCSRYKASRLADFLLALRALLSLEIAQPAIEDEWNAIKEYGKYPLGISDLINLNLMKRLGINIIVSADKGFDRYPGIKRVFSELSAEREFEVFLNELQTRGIVLRNKHYE